MEQEEADRQKALTARYEQLKKAAEQEAQVNAALRMFMDEAAYSRLSNIRISNPSMYGQLASYILSMVQGGKLRGKLTEEQLKKLASLFLSQKKESSITRISK